MNSSIGQIIDMQQDERICIKKSERIKKPKSVERIEKNMGLPNYHEVFRSTKKMARKIWESDDRYCRICVSRIRTKRLLLLALRQRAKAMLVHNKSRLVEVLPRR
jgi:hypothetical protein